MPIDISVEDPVKAKIARLQSSRSGIRYIQAVSIDDLETWLAPGVRRPISAPDRDATAVEATA